MIPWAAPRHVYLSMEFPRQKYWGRLPFLTPGDLPNPGIEPTPLVPPALASRFFTIVPSGKPCSITYWDLKVFSVNYGSPWTLSFENIKSPWGILWFEFFHASTFFLEQHISWFLSDILVINFYLLCNKFKNYWAMMALGRIFQWTVV